MPKYISAKAVNWAMFALTAVLIIGIPAVQIFCYERVLACGTSYRIPCRPYDPYNPFSGRYVRLNLDVPGLERNWRRDNGWVLIGKNEKGQLTVKKTLDQRPEEGDYLRANFSSNLKNFYMNEKLAPAAEKAVAQAVRSSPDKPPRCELEVMVYNGMAVGRELYIDNIPIRQFLAKNKNAL